MPSSGVYFIFIYFSVGNLYQLWLIVPIFCLIGGTRWSSWLRHCATSRKVVGSIPDGVIGFFQ